MLLYVNKKAIRRKKIRILLIILAFVIFASANIICFKQKFHTSTQTPNDYVSIKKEPLFIESYPIVQEYTYKNNETKQILIPKNITEQSANKIAQILKNKKITSVFFTNELKNNNILHDIIKFFDIQISNTIQPQTIIISSDINLLTPTIYEKKLFPKTIIYQKYQNPKFNQMLEQHFPSPLKPKDKLSKEVLSLQSFITDYKLELINLVKNKDLTKQKFSHQEILLQNINFCLQTNNNLFCNIDAKISFAKKIKEILKNIPLKDTVQKLILLTSFEPTKSQTIAQEYGLLFKFENRNTILLPHQITQNAYEDIKIKAGINPTYTNDNMKFYQFKIVEINIDDNI